jgi:hypothetical protein
MWVEIETHAEFKQHNIGSLAWPKKQTFAESGKLVRKTPSWIAK